MRNYFLSLIVINRLNTNNMSYYKIDNLEQYFKHYNKSIREPRKFWGKVASENFTWYQEWEKVIEFDMAEAKIEWFVGGETSEKEVMVL